MLHNINNAQSIPNGDILHNLNCYEYLSKVAQTIKVNTTLSNVNLFENWPSLLSLKNFFAINQFQYNANVAYGNLYTDFLQSFVKDITQRKKALNQIGISDISDIIAVLFENPNQSLLRAYKMMEKTIRQTNQTSKEIETLITKKMYGDASLFSFFKRNLNDFTPQDAGNCYNRTLSVVGSHFQPQFKTSLPSVRQYVYNQDVDTGIELRLGTQVQYVDGKVGINPLFKAYLDVLAEKHTNEKYIYFNLLGLDRTGLEGDREKEMSLALHELESQHPNLIVITLPADKGLMDHHLLNDNKTGESAQIILEKMLRIAMGVSDMPTRDFYISDAAKQLLYSTGDGKYEMNIEEVTIRALLKSSFEKLNLLKNDNLTQAEMQAVYFHFIKFELPNVIISKIKPTGFNMSCKDGIDRGGVASAYYHLMKSIESGHPLSINEFEQALHAAAINVKGRGINQHSQVIWNALYYYVLANKDMVKDDCPWLVTWLTENKPEDRQNNLEQLNTEPKEQLGDF